MFSLGYWEEKKPSWRIIDFSSRLRYLLIWGLSEVIRPIVPADFPQSRQDSVHCSRLTCSSCLINSFNLCSWPRVDNAILHYHSKCEGLYRKDVLRQIWRLHLRHLKVCFSFVGHFHRNKVVLQKSQKNVGLEKVYILNAVRLLYLWVLRNLHFLLAQKQYKKTPGLSGQLLGDK